MSREKQIEEMARFIVENTDLSVFDIAENIGQALYNAGYRKQSGLTPCDVCRFNPPTSRDNAPCTICPAQAYTQGETNDQ